MIVLYDGVQTRASHAPFTRAFTQMVAHACPGQPIVIHARASHLQAAFAGPDPLLDGRLTQQALAETASGPSLRRTLRFLRAIDRHGSERPALVIFLSASPSDIWAAKLFRRWSPGFRCHLALHGDLCAIQGPRPRNLFRRVADLAGSIAHANHPDVRFLVLEPHIVGNLAAALPAVAAEIDVIHHPCLPAEVAWQAPGPSAGPLRLGLLGIAGPSKGLDVFARVAQRVASAAGEAAEFRLIGKVQRGWRDLDLSGISGPRPFSEDWLPRDVFERELADLHYVVLPYNMDYYALAASGVLLDALCWRKPIISFHTPAIDELTARFGEIGHVCADENDMFATVQRLLRGFDDKRYQAQRRNLDAAYRSRLPETLAPDYARLLRTRWGGHAACGGPAETGASGP